jgi:hypothetical protein
MMPSVFLLKLKSVRAICHCLQRAAAGAVDEKRKRRKKTSDDKHKHNKQKRKGDICCWLLNELFVCVLVELLAALPRLRLPQLRLQQQDELPSASVGWLAGYYLQLRL